VLAPHPDDEIFGCGGVLLEAVRTAARIHVAVVTDGSAQGDAAARRAESVEAARRLGIPEPAFWGFADRSLEPADPTLLARLRWCLEETDPELVLVPSPAETHPDHRALALAVYRVLRETTSVAAREPFHLAAYEVSAPLRPNRLVDLTADWDRIAAASRAFTSQHAVQPYLEVLEAMATMRRLTLGPGVTRAAAYHVVDAPFIAANPVRAWAARIGPTDGLELDDPGLDDEPAESSLIGRLLGRRGSGSGPESG
jgi:LmbE family N-acetylglucosaminyl deacetylase